MGCAQVDPAQGPGRPAGAISGAMYRTFELYLRNAPQAAPRFEPLTCRTALEVMERARGILETDTAVASVEVRLAGEHLFTLER